MLVVEVKRVVKIGGSYYIALPKAWVLENRLEGGYVAVEAESGGVLRVRVLGGEKERGPLTARINCRGDVLRGILSAYLRGFEVIEVELEDSCRESALQAVSRAQSLLVGLELVEESKKTLSLQCFTREDYTVESLLSRMSAVSLLMLEKASEALRSGDEDIAKEVHELDDRVDRLYFLAVRIIRGRVMNPLTPPEERVRLVDLRLVARYLEDIADTYESLASLASTVRCEIDRVDLIQGAQKAVFRGVLERREKTQEVREVLSRAKEYLSRANLPDVVGEKLLRVLDLLEDAADLV